jgi:carboxylate-amine ligase
MSMQAPAADALDPAAIAASFDTVLPLTVGLEEEVFLVDPESLDLAPRALELLANLGEDARFKPELPAAQLEIVTPPARTVAEAVAVLAEGRAALSGASAANGVLPISAGVHPFAAVEGELNSGERYDRIAEQHGLFARRQLVSALQVHVAVGGADRTLAVYNALRSYLPELAALAANAPFHGGRDTGLASVRPKLGEALPRQGVPPPIDSWAGFAADLRWGASAGALADPGMWWWELRPHPRFATLELRVPDSQTTLAESTGVAAFAHCLVAWLASRYDAGERLPSARTWRIEENRWSACRDGVQGTLADLDTGETVATRARLHELVNQFEPLSERLGCSNELSRTRAMIDINGSLHQRAIAEAQGLRGLVAWLAERFRAPHPG